MKILKKLSFYTVLLTIMFTFKTFAMNNVNNDLKLPNPYSEQKHDDRSLDWRWTWINDDTCIRFNTYENRKKEELQKQYDYGMLSKWGERIDGNLSVKNRESYSGKWSQSDDGIWSFTFDDYTIPVGVTKIDGVMYAFNTFGELKAGYEYYTGFKTEADGLIKADSAEFTQWLTTQYLPECTSHE